MIGQITTGAPEIPLWLWLLASMIGPVGIAGVVIAFLPSARRWREARAAHERRVESTCDDVQGHWTDGALGPVVWVPGIKEAIGPLNGKGPVMTRLGTIEEHLGIGGKR